MGHAAYVSISGTNQLGLIYRDNEYEVEASLRTLANPPTANETWKDVTYQDTGDVGGYMGGECYTFMFGKSSNDDIYYARNPNSSEMMGPGGGFINLSSLSFTKIQGLSGVKNMPKFCESSFYQDEDWSGEEPVSINVVNIKTAALAVDSNGRLWKIYAAINSSGTFTGIEKTQIGNDTDWKWSEGYINKNSWSVAQKGNYFVKLKCSNDNNLTITYEEYRDVSGKILTSINNVGDGTYCAIFKPGTTE